jgi:hypothetical protein
MRIPRRAARKGRTRSPDEAAIHSPPHLHLRGAVDFLASVAGL